MRFDVRQTLEIGGILVSDPNGFTFAGQGGQVGSQITVLASWGMDKHITS